jgi:hypothetical protein
MRQAVTQLTQNQAKCPLRTAQKRLRNDDPGVAKRKALNGLYALSPNERTPSFCTGVRTVIKPTSGVVLNPLLIRPSERISDP